MLILCDFTIDAVKEVSEEERVEQKAIKEKFDIFAEEQEKLIAKLKLIVESKEQLQEDQLEDAYKSIRELENEHF